MTHRSSFGFSLALAGLVLVSGTALRADNGNGQGSGGACKELPTYSDLKAQLKAARGQANGGFNLDMWATVVNRDGVVCAVAFTGDNRGDQWPGSRAISAQKANTANAFSLPGLALSTANLFTAVQPGGSLYGLQASNPVDTGVAYGGNSANNGQANDPMVGGKIGGVNVFGGGLALYNAQRSADRGDRGEWRFFLRRSQHRLENSPRTRARLRARRRERRCDAAGQYCVRHHLPARPDAGRQHQRMGASGLQRCGDGDRRLASGGQPLNEKRRCRSTFEPIKALHFRCTSGWGGVSFFARDEHEWTRVVARVLR